MLDPVIGLVTQSTLSLVITIIICIIIVLCILKKFSKMIIISVSILLIYMGYLFFTGQKVPTNKDEILEHGSEKLKQYKIEDKMKKIENDIKDNIKENIKDGVKDELLKTL